MANEKQIPTGVKIISVLYYIAVASCIIGIIVMLFAGQLISTLLESFGIPFLGALGSAIFVIGSIVMLGGAVLSFFIARGLWRGKNWARILVIVFAAIGSIWGIISVFTASVALVNIAISVLIGAYLLFNKEAKRFFS